MAKFSSLGIIAISVILSCERCYSTCKYYIKDLPRTIEIENNLNYRETIFTFTLLNAEDDQMVSDRFLISDDSQPYTNTYFRTVNEPSEIVGTYQISGIRIEDRCPPPGTSEAFFLKIHDEDNCKYTVDVEVSAAIIDFHVQPMAEISVNQTHNPVIVVQFQITGIRQCIQYECFVEALNSNTTFTMVAVSDTFTVTTMPEYISFDYHYFLEIICFQTGSAILDAKPKLVIAVFKTHSVSTKLSTDSIYSATNTLANYSTLTFPSKKNSLRAISSSIKFQTNSVTKFPKLRGLSTDNTSSNFGSYSSTKSTPSSATFWTSDMDKSVRSMTNILQSYGYNTTPNNLSGGKLLTSKFIRTSMTFESTTTLSAVSSTLLRGQSSTAQRYHSSNDANDIFDNPVYIAGVSSAAGAVGLGAAGVLTYYASRRCKLSSAISPAVINDD